MARSSPGPAALDRPGRLPARQPRQRRHAAGGGPDRAVLRRGRRRGRRPGSPAGLLVAGPARRLPPPDPLPVRRPLRVAMSVDEVRAASFRISYEMHDGPGRGRPGRGHGLDPDGHLRPRRRQRPRRLTAGRAGVPRRAGRAAMTRRCTVPGLPTEPRRPGRLRRRGSCGSTRPRVVRLRAAGPGRVTAWAATPFDVLATRTVPGTLEPGDVTAPARGAAHGADRGPRRHRRPGRRRAVAGRAAARRRAGPPSTTVPAAELEGLTERGLAVARENAGPLGPPASLLDQTVLTVSGPPAAAAGRR